MKLATIAMSVAAVVFGQPYRIGSPGITRPEVVRRLDPEYSNEARSALAQGTVLLELTISEQGRAADIAVLSPVGFGLDEKAVAAIEKWVFKPGLKDGVPVPVLVTIEVNFRLKQGWMNEKTEKQRTAFNQAVAVVNRPNAEPAVLSKSIQKIKELSDSNYPAAMFTIGTWKLAGQFMPKDTGAGMELLQKAAAAKYSLALYEVGMRRVRGRDLPQDVEAGMQQLRDASVLGNQQAQYFLGNHYGIGGDGVPKDLDRARRYFRLCAAQAVAACQHRLGQLLYESPDRKERDLLQAVAWFELAADQNFAQAQQALALAREQNSLGEDQQRAIRTLKQSLSKTRNN
jgi:TonB family protein